MGCLPEGLIDWDAVYSTIQPHATFAAGVLFGVAWWIWGDAQLYSMSVGHSSFSPLTLIPGLVATAAVVIMNFVSREEVRQDALDDADAMRAKLVLLLSYLISLGAICGAVVLLVQAHQGGKDMWVGASGVLQCCLVLASGLLCWFFHAGEEAALGGYGYL
ncbi:Transmembrane protein 50B [Pleodorina starrii]|uniref:Transmembrane protein 50B n=1 Tax=Pleodorina starrii TaxID=330485 RepID=A0A9W6BRR7_9CHLO|nr:Transmembrane protein 50B [Pleodorina starrii]GLC56740.1 Transmembrane protein 50B [Pleodorina starrii]GLC66897.1 Transmembrane protein 50B [Pleodorina starrii]